MRVLKFAVVMLLAALAFLSGCSTSSQDELPPDWAGNNAPVGSATNEQTNPPVVLPSKISVHTNLPPVIHTNQIAVRPPPIPTWTSLDRWASENKIGPLRHVSASPVSTWALNSKYGNLVLALG